MAGWWRRNPYFLRYMLREASALFLAGYALVLLLGLYRLWQGEAAYAAWRQWLGTPASIGLHALALLFALYHSLTWFQVMPKTAPPLPLPPRLISAAGIAAMLLLSAALLVALGLPR
jgi:fumarate reductase subunit C